MSKKGLILKKVSKHINGLKLIDNVTASFLPGRITALIGPNGAGKTTLFHLITGELMIDTGAIVYNKDNIANLPPYKVARMGVGRLFQDVRIFSNLSVFENIASSCYPHNSETPWYPLLNRKRMRILNKSVKEKADYFIDFVGLTDMSHVSASSLSFGQQKLLAIARLLAGEFSLLLLDEPTAGLNPVMVRKVLGVLDKIIEMDNGKTIVLVEHNMSVVTEIADWVYFINEGKISFFGRTDHVLGDKEVRELYLGF